MKYAPTTENFFENVYDVVRLIPKGRVTSYGAIARYLGAAGSSRMVGWAMNGAGKYPDVPAHRVVNRAGLLTGKMHFGSSIAMEQMLEEEGIKVKEDAVVNFKKNYWDPVIELGGIE
ncbi:MAG: methylated-DNA-protein-cysteine methyltransferase-like protein [Flavobacteriales bacterium]|jgi:methylated-DNA-protein-cysteine methyltransferase-like protein